MNKIKGICSIPKWLSMVAIMSALIFIPRSSHADCGLLLSAGNIVVNWELSYSPQVIQFNILKQNFEACNYWIGITRGAGSSPANRFLSSGDRLLRYQIYRDTSLNDILQDPSDSTIGGQQQLIVGGFPEGVNINQTATFVFSIPTITSQGPTIVKNGVYTDVFQMRIYEGSNVGSTAENPVMIVPINVTVHVPKIINVSLVAPGSGFVENSTSRAMDFGLISGGQSKSVDLRIRTNAGVSVSFSSRNNGQLRPENGSNEASGIPYFFYVNGVLINLDNSANIPVQGLFAVGETDMNGLSYPIRVEIRGATSNSMKFSAGIHSDSILITAATND